MKIKKIFTKIFIAVFTSILLLSNSSVGLNSKAEAVDLKENLVLYVGSSQALINDTETAIDEENASVKPVIKNGRTLIPVRFIAEKFGAKVDWEAKTSKVIIESSGRLSRGRG